ncbi:Short repeat-containing protein of unknown function [Lentzea albidocapillata subsp. violacea]|uniref:Uncharacterized protein n=1 Tax=Lentzea albidocapillata subsp. violacea TaxID=128104 RepID=A0A1G9IQ73_9PSEU|nr:ALF repeat-containing protein [Lentzea albidocapillata]SDL27166.1 Short repeat-containing protein of unknown function [Lentzea albidocapillata subsp. violacea]
MKRRASSATSLWRRSVVPICAALALTLFGGTVHATAAPQSVPVLQAAANNDPPPQEVDEEYEFYKMLITDISERAEDVEVRDAAKAALAVNTKEKLIWFLDHGQAEAQARADTRKAAEKAENRRKVEEWARTGGPNVRSGAQAALNAGDQAIKDFVAYGYEIALKRDKQQAEDDKAEQDRIIARVRDMVAMGGPQVKIEGEAVLASKDYARIRQFYLTDYHEANKRDHAFRAVIQKALEDRNRAITELDQLARRAAAVAAARAEIIRANIDAVKHLEDVTYTMKRAVEAAHRSDQIFRDDKPGRAHGQLGRNELLDVERAKAERESADADRIALASVDATGRARAAGAKLVDLGVTDGLDWARVTIGIGNAVDAAALAAETSAHATVATLADSRALDADRNAQEHAQNAAKYRAEAERQAAKAAELAEAAKKQRDIALAARDRAERQKNIANAKAAEAQSHATNARNHRVNAQSAARNAAVTAAAAHAANAEAARLAGDHDAAMAKIRTSETEVRVINGMHQARLINLENFELRLTDAEARARERGENVEEVTREIRGQRDAARGAANESAGWASRAAASASAARESARLAAAAAQGARTAANNATREAVTARQAADEAYRITVETVNVALGAQASAEMTQQEAEAAVHEANQAVYQSVIADRAASAAAASASLVIDSSRAAEAVLKPYAAINADARRALETVSEALIISEEQSRLAREKADEAAAAAVRATKAADDALLEVKPAYEAAARAAQSANDATQYAQTANDAANQAVAHATAAHSAAGTATRWSNTASADATLAGNAAAAASASAASAERAAVSTEHIYSMARANADKVQEFLQRVVDQIESIHEYRVRLDAAEQIAREEAAKKAAEMNLQLAKGIWTVDRCLDNPFLHFEDCQRAAGKIEEFAKYNARVYADAAVATLNAAARCGAGDQDACNLLRSGQDKLSQYYKGIGEGVIEGAKGALDGLLTGLTCIGGSVFAADYRACQEISKGLQYTLEHPYTLIHLEEWRDNPAKALGLTFWDLGTAVAGAFSGGAAASTRVLGALKNVLGKGVGKVLNNVVDLRSVAVKLHDSVPVKLPGSVAEILFPKFKLENGIGKLENAVVSIDGRLYRLESYSQRLEGDLTNLNGSVVRLEGGVIRLENGMAKLDDAKLKVEPCGPAGGCEGLYKTPQVVDGEYRHDIGALQIRIKAENLTWGREELRKAKLNEPDITKDVNALAEITGGRREGIGYELKSESSFLRKQFEETEGDTLPPASIKAKMNDSVRYTYVFDPKVYADSVKRVITEFTKKGYTKIALKNFWLRNQEGLPEGAPPRNGYPGINMTWESPNGQLFELQLHTPHGYAQKVRETSFYEDRRAYRAAADAIRSKAHAEGRNLTLHEWAQIQTYENMIEDIKVESAKLFSSVEPPEGAIRIPQFPAK